MPYIRTRDHTQLFYIDGGQGAPVVFVASAWLNSQMWEFQIPYLVDRGLRCVAYDRRGHGRSDSSWDGYDYDTLADDLAALLDHLDLREVSLVSHSAGAGEIIRYLTRYGSDRIARIAMVSATTPFLMQTADNPEGIDRTLIEADLAVRTADRPKWFADNADGFLGAGLPGVEVSAEFAQFTIAQCLSCSIRATAAFFVAGFTTDFRSEMRSITVPTLIVHGDHDLQAPIALCATRAARLIPHSTLLVYENAAHGLYATHSGRLNADLFTFLRAHRAHETVARVGV